MNISPHKLYRQYFIGLSVNILVFLLLYLCPLSHNNTQMPCGTNKNNIWCGTDINDYVNSGLNYVHTGIFGMGDKPDHLRTIGYPAIIAFFYSVFGDSWVLALQISQCFFLALMYPILSLLAVEILPSASNKTISAIFIFLLFTGTYWARSIMLLTDTTFALLFTVGVVFGIRAFKKDSFPYFMAYIVFITAAGLIRPTLFLFPLLNITLAIFVATKYRFNTGRFLPQLVITTLLFAFTCNLASIRNYLNYSFLSPSSVVGLNAFRSVAQKILIDAGSTDKYNRLAVKVDSIQDISAKTEFRKKIMIAAICKHPLLTAKMLQKNTINVFLDNHMVNNMGNYFGYNWKTTGSAQSTFGSAYPYKKSTLCYYLTYAMMGLYFVLWLLLFYFCYVAFITRQYHYLYLIGSLLFVFIFPAVIIGDGGSRLRLPFEPFLVLFSVYQGQQIFSV